ncbi:MAG: cytochrome ubiquinol oxidase subunit I [Thermoguttaceae bacterium]
MEFDVALLSRLQFAFTIMVHYLFPPLSIGLSVLLVVFEAIWLKTGDPGWHRLTRFWVKLFAVTFAVGVATGLVMEFQFGTNWAVYSRFVGDVFGSALAAEGIFAFFLESGFLAVLVFGWDRVGKKMHFFSTLMVSLGSIFSSIWIVVANSWQQTPAGHHFVAAARGERAEIVDFWSLVFNPSTLERLVHVWIGAMLTGTFFVMSISAYYLLKNRHVVFARRSFTVALILGTIAAVAAPISGDSSARLVAREQPSKLAAMEGLYETTHGPTPITVVGLPDQEARQVKYAIRIPAGLTLLTYRDTTTPVVGLDHFRPEDRPPVLIPFVGFHLMVAIGTLLVAMTLTALFFLWRGRLLEQRWLLWGFVLAIVPVYLANQAGWVVAEVGRQPWIVQAEFAPVLAARNDPQIFYRYYQMDFTAPAKGLRTHDAVSGVLTREMVVGSLAMFGVIYLLLVMVWVFVLNTKIHAGPEEAEHPEPGESKRGGFFAVAADQADAAGPSFTEARRDQRGNEGGRTPPAGG